MTDDVRSPGTSTSPPPRRCPKCGRDGAAGEAACARCGLLVARFDQFAATGDPPELEMAWRACCEQWDSPSVHERAMKVATRFECLPALARRYRERLEAGDDSIAERRLHQIAFLIETAIRSQSKRAMAGRATRAVRLLGYVMAGLLLLVSAWVCFMVLRGHR